MEKPIGIHQKLGIMIRFNNDNNKELDKLFEHYGILINDCFTEIKKRFDKYEQLDKIKKGTCSECKTKDKSLMYKEKKSKKIVCNSCFMRTWSEYTLWTDYHKKLEGKYNFFIGNQGYLNGAINNSVQIFKSFIEKKKKRNYEIKRLKDDLLLAEGTVKKLEFEFNALKKKVKTSNDFGITERLNKTEKDLSDARRKHKLIRKKKLRPISFPKFNNNSIYMGNQNMFEFIPNLEEIYKIIEDKEVVKKDDYINVKKLIAEQTKGGYLHNEWQLLITNPYKKREKWDFKLLLGKKIIEKSKKRIAYQKRFILDCIDKKQWKMIRPKLIKENYKNKKVKYFLVFPARVIEEACVDLTKEVKKNKAKDIIFCCLSFGINRPITLTAIKNKKILDFKTFGDGYPSWRAEREMLLKSKISRFINIRHGKLENLFTIKNAKDCLGMRFDKLNECTICKVRNTCKREYNALIEQFPFLKSNRLLKKIARERKFKKRHSNKRLRTAMIKILQEKISNRLSNFKNSYDHILTYELISYCKEHFKNPIFVVRDTKNIKNIMYSGFYRKSMKDWSINQQKLFLKYKGLLNGIGFYQILYKDVNEFKCPKCNKELGKVTTIKLKKQKRLVCDCGFNNDLYFQDCFMLYSKVREQLKI